MAATLNIGPVVCDATLWLEYLVGSTAERCREATDVIGALTTCGSQIWVASSTLASLDRMLPRALRSACAGVTPLPEADPRALEACARAAVTHVMDLARVASIGQRECERARELWPRLSDFERNLVVAAAESIGAARIVTYDESFRAAYPEICVDPCIFLAGTQG